MGNAQKLHDPWLNPELKLLFMQGFASSPCVLWGVWFPSTSSKHADRWIDYTNLPLAIQKCVCVFVCAVPCDGLLSLSVCIPALC